ncbi:hypothetical protein NMY22_g3605 [Coprinellus aureogranulatus]|nr:hypothetical protein NMY22_g3605 [Coprinellus aureogranulatus]
MQRSKGVTHKGFFKKCNEVWIRGGINVERIKGTYIDRGRTIIDERQFNSAGYDQQAAKGTRSVDASLYDAPTAKDKDDSPGMASQGPDPHDTLEQESNSYDSDGSADDDDDSENWFFYKSRGIRVEGGMNMMDIDGEYEFSGERHILRSTHAALDHGHLALQLRARRDDGYLNLGETSREYPRDQGERFMNQSRRTTALNGRHRTGGNGNIQYGSQRHGASLVTTPPLAPKWWLRPYPLRRLRGTHAQSAPRPPHPHHSVMSILVMIFIPLLVILPLFEPPQCLHGFRRALVLTARGYDALPGLEEWRSTFATDVGAQRAELISGAAPPRLTIRRPKEIPDHPPSQPVDPAPCPSPTKRRDYLRVAF